MLFNNVAIESLGYVLAPQRVTSAELEEQIAPTMKRLGVPLGRLEALSGIRERRFWAHGTMPSVIATQAAQLAIERLHRAIGGLPGAWQPPACAELHQL